MPRTDIVWSVKTLTIGRFIYSISVSKSDLSTLHLSDLNEGHLMFNVLPGI